MPVSPAYSAVLFMATMGDIGAKVKTTSLVACYFSII